MIAFEVSSSTTCSVRALAAPWFDTAVILPWIRRDDGPPSTESAV